VATRTASVVSGSDAHARNMLWEALTDTTSDVGNDVELPDHPDMSVQVIGTFGVGGTVIMEGSNDGGTTYFALVDPQGNAISFTAAGGEQIAEAVKAIRPRVTGGDVTTDLDVYLYARSNR